MMFLHNKRNKREDKASEFYLAKEGESRRQLLT